MSPRRKAATCRRTPYVPQIYLTALGVFIFTAILLFTWFGRNWSVFTDLLHAVPRFAARAGGEGHEKPFGYYFHLLDPMMILSLVAVAGIYAALCDAVSGARQTGLWLAIYGLVVFVIYSAIPYKTPWLALNLWLPLALLCGLGVSAFWEQFKNPAGRWSMGIAGAFLLALLGLQTKLWAFDQPADEKNPFAYAHTVEDLFRLPARLEELTRQEKLSNPAHRRRRCRCVAAAVVSAEIFAGRILAAGPGNRRRGFFHHPDRRFRPAGGAAEKFSAGIFWRAAQRAADFVGASYK